MQISPDSLSSTVHGIIEVRVGGVWGRVCMQGWDNKDANVACKQLGFAGGVSYLHIMKNRKPIMMRNVSCTGDESALDQCNSSSTPHLGECHYEANDAGVLCYKTPGKKLKMKP